MLMAATARGAGRPCVNEHLQRAIASMAAVAERAGYLTRDEQETLAVRLETFAERLHWEQWFHLPESALADQITAEAPKVAAVADVAEVVLP